MVLLWIIFVQKTKDMPRPTQFGTTRNEKRGRIFFHISNDDKNATFYHLRFESSHVEKRKLERRPIGLSFDRILRAEFPQVPHLACLVAKLLLPVESFKHRWPYS